MRFACEHCGKRYVVKDELLPGRTYRSKCKVCGHIIVVKGEDSSADDLQVVPSSDAAVPAATSPRPGATTTPPAAPVAPSRPSIPAPGAAPRAVIPIPAPAPVAAPSRPAIMAPSTPAAAPAPAAPSRPTIPPPVFTQPPTPPAVATLAAATAAMPPASAPAPAKPAREDSGYIDLFDGKGFDDLAPLESQAEDSVLRESTVIPPPPPRRPITAPVVAPLPEIIPPSAAIVRTPIEATTVKPRRMAPMIIGAVAVVLVGALGTVAVLRPWRAAEGPEAARSSLPTDKPTAPVKPPPAEATAAVVPPAKAEPAAEPAKAEPAAAEPAKVAAAEPAKAAEEPPKAAEPAKAAVQAKEEEKVAKIQEGLSTAAIRRVLRSSKRAFDRCVANPSRGLPKPLDARHVSLRLSVEPTGAVSGLAIDDAAVAKAPVGQCLKAAGMKVVFPTFHGPPILVDAPVELPAPATTNPPPPAPPDKEKATQPSGPPMVAVEFSGVSRTVTGGEIGDTRYSQKPDDTSITDRQYNEGVLTYSGQVGLGNGSAYGGIGFYVNVRPGGQPIDASRFKSVTLRLSSPTTKALRVRLQGPEQSVASAGCYPMVILGVSEKMKTFKIALDDFSPDLGCGARGRYPEDTLPQLVGFEVVDISVQNKPTSFSVGSITLNP